MRGLVSQLSFGERAFQVERIQTTCEANKKSMPNKIPTLVTPSAKALSFLIRKLKKRTRPFLEDMIKYHPSKEII